MEAVEQTRLPMPYAKLLELAQAHISEAYTALLTDADRTRYLPIYLERFLTDTGYTVSGMTREALLGRLVDDMARYSVLTAYLEDPKVEEINVNAWDDIAVTYTDGRTVKPEAHFESPRQATDTVKRLLRNSGAVIDDASPISMGHLNSRIRVTVMKTPIVDAEVGVAVSIRILHPRSIGAAQLVQSGFATWEILDFLGFCIRYGVSFVIAGVTSSGKTTLLNALLSAVPDERRIFTVKTGSRELSLVRREGGRVRNNVVHTLSRPSDDPAFDISQENLLEVALRFHPDIICVGEMRNVEAYTAVQATQTGHTVVSTVHARTAEEAHRRIALLCEGKLPMRFEIARMLAAEAFPIVVTTNLLENHERRIVTVTECGVSENGSPWYRVLWRYEILHSERDADGLVRVSGAFRRVHPISDGLLCRFRQAGAPDRELLRYTGKENPDETD